MFCKNCGKEYNDGKFCQHCGSPVQTENTSKEHIVSQPVNPLKAVDDQIEEGDNSNKGTGQSILGVIAKYVLMIILGLGLLLKILNALGLV